MVSEQDSVADLAMAHLRLSQSLRSMASGSQAYRDTEEAISDLSKGIAARALPRSSRDRHDWKFWPEPIQRATLIRSMSHEDGRCCFQLSHLYGVWIFDVQDSGLTPKRCLRDHDGFH